MKRQANKWEKIFANLISDKALISRTHKEFSKLNPEKTHSPMGQRHAQTFFGKGHTDGK